MDHRLAEPNLPLRQLVKNFWMFWTFFRFVYFWLFWYGSIYITINFHCSDIFNTTSGEPQRVLHQVRVSSDKISKNRNGSNYSFKILCRFYDEHLKQKYFRSKKISETIFTKKLPKQICIFSYKELQEKWCFLEKL